jgi:hypothetical protein
MVAVISDSRAPFLMDAAPYHRLIRTSLKILDIVFFPSTSQFLCLSAHSLRVDYLDLKLD